MIKQCGEAISEDFTTFLSIKDFCSIFGWNEKQNFKRKSLSGKICVFFVESRIFHLQNFCFGYRCLDFLSPVVIFRLKKDSIATALCILFISIEDGLLSNEIKSEAMILMLK